MTSSPALDFPSKRHIRRLDIVKENDVQNISGQRVRIQVADGTTMNAYVAQPSQKGKFPGMLVFQEAFGVNAHIREVTERIAAEGYVALAPELFHRTAEGFEGRYDDFTAVMPHYQAITEAGATQDIQAAYQRLRAEDSVSEQIGSVGFCLGGRMSFLACTTVQLAAAISFYGGGIAPDLLHRVSNLSGPMLFFWGGLDQHIPQEQIRSVTDSLRSIQKKFITVYFSDADHGFFCDARTTYNAPAARSAWALTQEFLSTHVKEVASRTAARS